MSDPTDTSQHPTHPQGEAEYGKVSQMKPYDKIPDSESEATASAKRIYSNLKKEFPVFVEDFEAKWAAWVTTWFPKHDVTWVPASSRCVDEFYDLVALGPKIIPLVVYHLATSPEDFVAVELYNELEKTKAFLVDPKDVLNYMVLQRQANLIVDLSYRRTRHFNSYVEGWKKHCVISGASSIRAHYAIGQDYRNLVELGPGVVAETMLEYKKDKSGWWFALLQEVVHGVETEFTDLDRPGLYLAWSNWLEKEEHDKAPNFRQDR